MDANSIAQLIGSYGFPIVACVVLAMYVKTIIKNFRDDVQKLTDEHRQEMQEVTTALNNNTLVIQKLCDKMDK